MRVAHFEAGRVGTELLPARWERELGQLHLENAAWVALYTAVDVPIRPILDGIRRENPTLPIFGATSFQGIFMPGGFKRGAGLLIADKHDALDVAVSLKKIGAAEAHAAAQEACRQVARELGAAPNVLLLHATPGFEERILGGIRAVFGDDVPVYGGSAADDDISGRWQVFSNGGSAAEGFVLAGLRSQLAVRGAFLGGYLPTEFSGTVTRASGRTVHRIDGEPAAKVYDGWTKGNITHEVETGGSVLLKTNLNPVARLMGEPRGMPRRLLSHPHSVNASDGSLSFFSEFAAGDRITLMTSTKNPLVTRVARTVQRARGTSAAPVRGGLLVYCGGCLSVLLDRADEIAREFERALDGAPFIGLATFGEQGQFFDKTSSAHGNLMCTVVVF